MGTLPFASDREHVVEAKTGTVCRAWAPCRPNQNPDNSGHPNDRDAGPHVLRHSAAAWLMQAGTDLWEAAGYLGMTVEMLSQRYGHHHPDHLAGATQAFARHRLSRTA